MFNWSDVSIRHSIIAPALAFALGIVLVQWVRLIPPHGLLLGLMTMAFVIWGVWPRWRLLAWVILGSVWALWRASLVLDAQLPEAFQKHDFDVIGKVIDLPEQGRISTRFMFVVESAELDGKPFDLAGKVRLSWYQNPHEKLLPGTRWHLRLRLKRPRGLVNPGGYDSERSALQKRIAAVGYVRDDGDNYLISQTFFNVDAWRLRIVDKIKALELTFLQEALLRALAVGDTRGLSQRDWDVARANGVSHLLAISGFHIGMAAMFGAWLMFVPWWLWPRLGRFLPRPIAQTSGAWLIALIYAALAGFGLPTVRSLLMISVMVLVRLGRRHTSMAQTLSVALFVILWIDPLAVLAAGFWLSFAGVALLLLSMETGHGFWGYIKALGWTQWMMTISLLPLTVWFFGQASLLGLISNLVAIPVVSFFVVPLALFGALLTFINQASAAFLWHLGGTIAEFLWHLLEHMATITWIRWYPPLISLPVLLLAMLGVLWLFTPRGWPARGLSVFLLLPFFLTSSHAPQPGAFRLWVMDVGQGLALLVETRHHNLLYDAGAKYPSGFDLGEVVVVPMLHALGIKKLDTILISHGDNDHTGGARAVTNSFPEARRLAGEPERTGLAMHPCKTGQTWVWDGVAFTILHPDANPSFAYEGNDASCVLHIEGHHAQALLLGDLPGTYEMPLLAHLHAKKPLVLQVPHHGSKTSSSYAFIKALKPDIAVNSSGWLNRFHHPAKAVVKRYHSLGVPFYDTTKEGALKVEIKPDGKAFDVVLWRQKQSRYWRE